MRPIIAPTRRGSFLDLTEAITGAALLCGFAFPVQWRYGFGWADEGLLWYASQRTALGEVPLRDFFSYDPGRYYWAALIFRLTRHEGLFTLLASCAAFGAIGLAVIWFAMCKANLRWTWRIACAIMITIALGYPRHKVFEQTASLILVALVFLVLRRPKRAIPWFVFGIATGAAAILGRNHGVFYVIAASLGVVFIAVCERKWPAGRTVVSYVAGIVIGYSPLLIMIVAVPGFRDAFVDSVIFTKQWQLSLPIPFPWRLQLGQDSVLDALQAISISIACIAFPAIYICGIGFAAWAHRTGKLSRSLTLLAASSLAGISYLQQAFDRADFGHIAQATLPVFPAVFALASYCGANAKARLIASVFAAVFCLVCLGAWLPNEPVVAFSRLSARDPNAVAWEPISGKRFAVPRYEADVLRAVRATVDSCGIGKGEFWTAPHFPGIYAYLDAKAPFWELYYLYPRPPEFQRRHIAAMTNTRLILFAPEATVDGLERLKLHNTYPLLMKDITRHYSELNVPGLPQGMKMFGATGALRCREAIETK
ncbi:hypothetical protein [Caballeronia grimmiae]|uniref:Glycosyltransferase RgtA/B/C/D-like domain-containing protein n=1 Tax=Caballeronia grimmiae TaxID=1071679 RepID=A0A069PCC4_9BURK|nr:hypothetical protein [Caballeronia grimmiae]KDR37484.1 hypothetical protein BG57_02210 [Caballeronia grimmiae]